MRLSLLFSELIFHEGHQIAQGLLGAITFTGDSQATPRTGRQHQKPHDALAIDGLPVLLDKYVATVFGRELDEL